MQQYSYYAGKLPRPWSSPGVLASWSRRFVNVDVLGEQNLAETGQMILAANHISTIDRYILGRACPRHVGFAALDAASHARHVPPGPTGTRTLKPGLVDARPVSEAISEYLVTEVRAGRVVALFPEESISPTGALYRGHTMAATLARECQVPVTPVGLVGTNLVAPAGSRRIRWSNAVSVSFGSPVEMAESTRSEDEFLVDRAMTDIVMKRIAALTGQSMVPSYATQASDEQDSIGSDTLIIDGRYDHPSNTSNPLRRKK